MEVYLIEFAAIFFLIGVGFYLLPAGIFYWWFYVRKLADQSKKVQSDARFTVRDIRREVWLSLQTVFIFSILSLGLLQLIKSGDTAIYYDFAEFGWGYAVLSFFISLIFHDAYFYWTHRFMHWKPVFKYIHLGHHKSRTPSPWAILAFQPVEAVIQYMTFALLILFLPLHPVVIAIYLVYDSIVNTAGHNGFELVPAWVSKHPILKLGNTVAHHDFHHIDVTKNFGAFFNVWDRLMNTFSEGPKERKSGVQNGQ